MQLHYEFKNGSYQPIKLTKFEATDNQIKTWLFRMYGFKFNTFTDKGTVKVDRDQLESLGDYGKDLRRYLKLKKDLSQLGGTDNALIQSCLPTDQSIHGRVDTIGAATHRCLPLDYKIKTLAGPKLWSELSVGDLVYTYSEEFGEVLSPLKAINCYNSAVTQTFTDGTQHFTCTPDHNWLTTQGLKNAKDITIRDTIIL